MKTDYKNALIFGLSRYCSEKSTKSEKKKNGNTSPQQILGTRKGKRCPKLEKYVVGRVIYEIHDP